MPQFNVYSNQSWFIMKKSSKKSASYMCFSSSLFGTANAFRSTSIVWLYASCSVCVVGNHAKMVFWFWYKMRQMHFPNAMCLNAADAGFKGCNRKTFCSYCIGMQWTDSVWTWLEENECSCIATSFSVFFLILSCDFWMRNIFFSFSFSSASADIFTHYFTIRIP